METRHRLFNPTTYPGFPSTLSAICSDMEKEGWALISIVQHTPWEHVAVFQRDK